MQVLDSHICLSFPKPAASFAALAHSGVGRLCLLTQADFANPFSVPYSGTSNLKLAMVGIFITRKLAKRKTSVLFFSRELGLKHLLVHKYIHLPRLML
jgi:hypothetical protein